MDAEQRILLRGDKPLPLTPKVFDTLLILVERGGRIVEKRELIQLLWPDTFVEETNLTFNIKQLRRALGDDARHPRFIETVARRGYRFIAPVSSDENGGIETGEVANLDPIRSNTSASDAPPIESRTPRWHKWLTAFALMVLLVASLAGWRWWIKSAGVQPPSGRLVLAVLPLKNLTGDEAQDYFSDGLTEEMIMQLGNLDPEHIGVIARTSVMHYKTSQASLAQIGRELGALYVLEGSVRQESDKVRVTAQLIKVSDQTHVWARQYDRELSHLLELQSEIASEVTDEIDRTLGAYRQRVPPKEDLSSPAIYEAHTLYLKGLYFWNKRTAQSLEHAIDYFNQALERDPNYARAYAGLADSYTLMSGYTERPQSEFMPKAREAALNALRINESLAEAHASLAVIVQNYDWDWLTAEKEFRRAIELNPNYATAHHWYAEHLTWLGRFDEAFRENELARQLDPLSLIIAVGRATIFYYSRQYDRAIEQFRAVEEMEPDFPRAHLVRNSYVEKGMFSDALSDIEAFRLGGGETWYWSSLASVYGRSGRRARAQSAFAELKDLSHRQQVDPSVFVSVCAALGDRDAAISWMENAFAQRSNLTTFGVEPGLDSLRGDRRFEDLLRRIGLAQ